MNIDIRVDVTPGTAKRVACIGITFLVAVIAAVAHAVPITFVKNANLTASQLNQNFSDLDTRVTAADAAIATLQSQTKGLAVGSGFLTGTGAIGRQNPQWIQSVARNSAGNYNIQFQPNFFSSSPDCALTILGVGNYAAGILGESTTAISIGTTNGGAAVDASFTIVCAGSH